MGAFLFLAIFAVMGLVLYALFRGLSSFATRDPNGVEETDENGIPKSLAFQNRMMFARVKWQALALLLVGLLLMIAQAG